LTRGNAPWVFDGRFRQRFVRRYPEALGLLDKCGLYDSAAVTVPGEESHDGGWI
jgi:hypothetical protein